MATGERPELEPVGSFSDVLVQFILQHVASLPAQERDRWYDCLSSLAHLCRHVTLRECWYRIEARRMACMVEYPKHPEISSVLKALSDELKDQVTLDA